MATIKEQGSGYKITVSMGYDVNGKQIRHHMTWTPEPGMTARQIAKELKRQEVLFEERCKTQQVQNGNIKLADFAEIWFHDYAEKQLKARTVANYRYFLKRVNEGLGHLRLDRIQPRHLLSFYDNLEEENVRLDTTYTPAGNLKALLAERSITQAHCSRLAGVSIGTVEAAVRGKNVSAVSAEKISNALDVPQDQLFHPHSRGTLSGKTRLHYHRFISSMLETAVQWQYIPANPCARVAAPKAGQKEVAYLDEHEAALLLAALEGEPVQYRAVVLLDLHTGLRRAELCGLEWQDVDFKNSVLHIRRNSLYLPDKGIYTDTTKNESSVRSIKLPAVCAQMLKQYRSWQTQLRLMLGDQWNQSDRLFTMPDGSPIHPDTLTNWFSAFIKRHDLPKITLHGLRHTNATLLIAAGTNLRTVASRLGHSKVSTTTDIYAHAIRSADAAAADVLDDVLTPKRRLNT